MGLVLTNPLVGEAMVRGFFRLGEGSFLMKNRGAVLPHQPSFILCLGGITCFK